MAEKLRTSLDFVQIKRGFGIIHGLQDDMIRIDQLLDEIVAAVEDRIRPKTSIAHSTTIIPNANAQALTWVVDQDEAGLVSGTRFTIQDAGVYLVSTYLHWPSNGNGFRIVEICKNGEDFLNGMDAATNFFGDPRMAVTAVLALEADDFLELVTYQNSGSPLTPSLATFSLTRIGP